MVLVVTIAALYKDSFVFKRTTLPSLTWPDSNSPLYEFEQYEDRGSRINARNYLLNRTIALLV
jgi:hypothetical protein